MCVYVCNFPIAGQTSGGISTKFGTETTYDQGVVIGYTPLGYPPWGGTPQCTPPYLYYSKVKNDDKLLQIDCK